MTEIQFTAIVILSMLVCFATGFFIGRIVERNNRPGL